MGRSSMTEHPLFSRMRSRAWLKITMLVLLPLGLCWMIAERASWRPRTMPGARANVFQVAFSPDGKYLAVLSQCFELHMNGAHGFHGAILSGRDPRQLDDEVDVWDARGQTLLHKLRAPGQGLGSIAFSPDGRELAALALWRWDDRKHPNGTEVKVWDASTGRLKRSLQVFGLNSYRLFWTGNVLTFSSHAGVHQWDARTGKEMGSLLGDDEEAALSPDGKLLAVEYNNVYLRDIKTYKMRAMDGPDSVASLFTFSHDGTRLAARLDGKSWSIIRVWDTTSGKAMKTLSHSVSPRALALSCDNKLLASGDDDNAIRLWDVRSGALLRTLRIDPARTLAFSPDGSTLAAGSNNGTFTLWRIR